MGPLLGFMYSLLHVEIIRLLKKKRLDFCFPGINDVDIYKLDPSELPGLSETRSDEQVWNFFCGPYYKYSNSKRANRITGSRYWKITGKGCVVKDKSDKVIGSKKTLVFYKRGCASKKAKTQWVMHEFHMKDSPLYKRDFAFCYIQKNPKNKPIISTPDDGELSHNLASDSENIESLSTEFPHNLVSDPRNEVAANTPPMEDDQKLEEFNALLFTSDSGALQLPINPENGSNSSYSNGFGNDSSVWISHEDIQNAQGKLKDKYHNGQALPTDTDTDNCIHRPDVCGQSSSIMG